MNAEAAKQLTISNRAVAVTEAYNSVLAVIESKAKRGWTKVELDVDYPTLYKQYDHGILSDVFGRLREEGYRVNLISKLINWS